MDEVRIATRRIGDFANGFRVEESDDGFVLDFLVCSASERAAQLVRRVRIPGQLLPVVNDRIGEMIRKMDAFGMVQTDTAHLEVGRANESEEETSMDFNPGEFKRFRVLAMTHLGAHAMNIPKGAVIEFDGHTVRYGGQDYPTPAVRAAVDKGWLVPEADTTSTYVPQPAGVKVRPADQAKSGDTPEAMVMERATHEETVVGSLDASKERLESSLRPDAPAPVPTPAPAAAPVATAIKTATTEPSKKFPVVSEEASVVGGVEDQGTPVPVARIMTPAVQATKVDDVAKAAAATRALEEGGRGAVEVIAQEPENITATLPGGATGDVAEVTVGDTVQDILPGAASSGVPPAAPSAFTWETKGVHWRTRVSNAVKDHGDDPATLQKIFNIETASVIKHIKAQLSVKGS